jgi:hypothetical protein
MYDGELGRMRVKLTQFHSTIQANYFPLNATLLSGNNIYTYFLDCVLHFPFDEKIRLITFDLLE